MPQNSSTSKLSSFIGITLLIAVIAFTIFINFSTEKEVLEIEEEIHFEPFSEYDAAKFWKLEGLRTNSITISQNQKKTHIKIDKIVKLKQYNSFTEIELNTLKEITNTKNKFTMSYGTLIFKNVSYVNKRRRIIFEKVAGNALDTKTIRLMEIGRIFSRYQIQSTVTKPQKGDFTHITLKDGRSIFLIKKDAEVKDESYKNLLEHAEYLNDSTRIILPW